MQGNRQGNFIKHIGVGLVAIMALGCQSNFDSDKKNLEQKELTGHRLVQTEPPFESVPFRSRNFKTHKAKTTILKNLEAPTEQELKNIDLSTSVRDVQLLVLDAQGRVTRKTPKLYKLTLQLKAPHPETLQFTGWIQRSANGVKLEPSQAVNNTSYEVSGQCKNTDCQDEIDLGIRQFNGDGGVVAETKIFLQLNWAQVVLKRNRQLHTDSLSQGQANALHTMEKLQLAQVNSWEVPIGPSGIKVDLFDEDKKHAFSIKAPSIVTKEHAISAEVVQGQKKAPHKVSLEGNGDNHLLFRTSSQSAEDNSPIENLVELRRLDTPTTVVQKDDAPTETQKSEEPQNNKKPRKRRGPRKPMNELSKDAKPQGKQGRNRVRLRGSWSKPVKARVSSEQDNSFKEEPSSDSSLPKESDNTQAHRTAPHKSRASRNKEVTENSPVTSESNEIQSPASRSEITLPPPPEEVIQQHAFLRSQMGNPETPLIDLMVDDFDQNYHLPGVQSWIQCARNSKGCRGMKGQWRRRLEKFFYYANPVRELIEGIYHYFGITPKTALNMIHESNYFITGSYPSEASGTGPLGPSQISKALALDYKIPLHERNYLAPSLCVAARNYTKLMAYFSHSDSTIIMLGYLLGEGGAGKRVECGSAKASTAKNPDCSSRTEKAMNDKDPNVERFWRKSRYHRLQDLRNYHFTYRELVDLQTLKQDHYNYVDQFLSVYFISKDPEAYDFDMSDLSTALPHNVYPGDGVNSMANSVCREAARHKVDF
jgi:hypothetical protein